jgi:hypothetical protein
MHAIDGKYQRLTLLAICCAHMETALTKNHAPVRSGRKLRADCQPENAMPTQMPNAAERLEIERACERIVYAYSRALDLGDLSAAADFFAENGSMARPMAPDQVIEGRETIRASLLTRPKTLLTKHLATNVMIEVESRDAARGISYLTMISTTPSPDSKPPFISKGPLYFGEFKDRFVRENGVWKFLERRGSIQMKFEAAASQ